MTPAPHAVLSVRDLTMIGRGPVTILGGVQLTAYPGTVTALVGPSGCGKTTLLRACTGAIAPAFARTAGKITVLGADVLELPPADLRRLRASAISYVGQDPSSRLNPHMRVRQLLRETATSPSSTALHDLLTMVRLPASPDLLRRRPAHLSGGQARRVALARALARQPVLLLLDEPTAGLDPDLRTEMATLLRTLAEQQHIAVVVACHDPHLTEHADQVLELTGPGYVNHPPARPMSRPADHFRSASGSDGHPPVLAVRDVYANAGRHAVLRGATLTLPTGSVTAVIGESGSGKTTLARVISGLHPTIRGTTTLAGERLSTRVSRRTQDQRRRIQLVPQDPLGTLNPARTLEQTLARPLQLHRLAANTTAMEQQVAELLDMVQLPATFAARYPHELSGGQRQRVALARALAARPDLLICDEITSALDGRTADALMRTLEDLRRHQRLTVLLITHDHGLASRISDCVDELVDGQLRSYLT